MDQNQRGVYFQNKRDRDQQKREQMNQEQKYPVLRKYGKQSWTSFGIPANHRIDDDDDV